jgi:hypothetical protein
MTLLELYQRAEHQGIEVDDFRTKEIISASFPEGWIMLDSSKISSNCEEKVILAHELGHCETGSFYNVKSRCDTRGRHERRADKRAISMLVPEEAIKRGYCKCWELADYFEVTCEFMYKAMEYYREKELASGL